MPRRLSASGRASAAATEFRQRLRIGLRLADFQGDRLGVVGHVDARIVRAVGLRHFLGAVAQTHDAGRGAENLRLGQREELDAVAPVEGAGDVARKLQMLLLVLADRHVRRLVEQDVGRHQHRIGVEPEPGIVALLAGLLLELGHAVEPAQGREAAQEPAKLGMARDAALVEDDAAVGIDAGGDVGGGHFVRLGAELKRVLRQRERVQIDDAEDAVEIALEAHPVADRAEIIAEMQVAGRLDAGKDPIHRGLIARPRREGQVAPRFSTASAMASLPSRRSASTTASRSAGGRFWLIFHLPSRRASGMRKPTIAASIEFM